jgi:hypothetical protein
MSWRNRRHAYLLETHRFADLVSEGYCGIARKEGAECSQSNGRAAPTEQVAPVRALAIVPPRGASC